MPINLSDNIYVGVNRPLESKYLYGTMSYSSTASVCVYLTQSVRYQGLTVLIGTSSDPQEYWWQNGTSDSDLVLKQSLATGNITGSASSGYVTLWTGTTSVGYNSNLYWNSDINGLLIGTNSSYGAYSLQVNGPTYLYNSGSSSVGIYLSSSSTNNYTALYSDSYRSAFQFSNLQDYTYLKGSMDNGDSVFVIYDTSDNYQSTNILSLTAQPQTTNGGTGSFNLLRFDIFPSNGTMLTSSSIDQSYNYRDIGQYNLGNTVSCYRTLGLYGVIYESGTFSNEESSFRWQNMVSGNLSETMRLSGTNLLIGYTQSQGTYGLQVNGNAYVSGNISASGSVTAQTGGFDSDIRLKSDILYNPVIEGIDTIRSASYLIGGNSHIGYIAQEVQNIVPSSIIKKDDGYLALNYNEVLVAKVAFLENKVKELSDIIERNGLK